MPQPHLVVALAIQVRRRSFDLLDASQRAEQLKLLEVAEQLFNVGLELANISDELMDRCLETPPAPRDEDLPDGQEELPF